MSSAAAGRGRARNISIPWLPRCRRNENFVPDSCRTCGQPGFSLLEIVIAAAISMLLISAVSTLLLNQILDWQRGTTEMETRANLERTLAMILRDIRNGASLVLPTDPDSPVSWLELSLPDGSFSSTNVVRYEYDAADKEIQRNTQPVTGRVSSLTVDYHDFPPLIRISIGGYGFREVVRLVQGKAAMRSQVR